jgi:predicted GIY-YIG superfamily endonuclease
VTEQHETINHHDESTLIASFTTAFAGSLLVSPVVVHELEHRADQHAEHQIASLTAQSGTMGHIAEEDAGYMPVSLTSYFKTMQASTSNEIAAIRSHEPHQFSGPETAQIQGSFSVTAASLLAMLVIAGRVIRREQQMRQFNKRLKREFLTEAR